MGRAKDMNETAGFAGTNGENGAEAEDRNFVTSLSRGLDVLRCFRPNEPSLTNHDIASRTGLPKPTVSRLTYTLCKLDYLVHSERTGTYRLGAGVLSLGYGVLAGMEIGERAAEEMRRICQGPNPHLTAALGERHRLKVVYMAVRRSTEEVSLTMNIGARLPLFHSAMGRAIIVALSPAERETLVDMAKAERPEDAAQIDDSVAKALADYEARGFVTGFGDWRPQVHGIAVPVISLNGDRIYGLNVGGPSFLTDPEELMRDYGDRLVAAGQALSYRGPAA